jgi:hypothetical protein
VSAVTGPDTSSAENLKAELAEAQAAHRTAHNRYRRVDETIGWLRVYGVLADVDAEPGEGAPTRQATRPVGRELDGIERQAVLTDLERRREAAASAFLASRERLNAARLEHANRVELPPLADRHAKAAEAVEQARADAEQAYVEAVARCIRLKTAEAREGRAAQPLRDTAVKAAASKEAGEALRESCERGDLPTAVDEHGPAATQPRPDGNLWGLGSDRWRPGALAFGDEFAELIDGGVRRLDQCGSERVAQAIRKRIEQLDREES